MVAYADDGVVFRRQISSPPGETQDPEPEGEHAFIKLMNFRVPAQTAAGERTTIDYITVDGEDANDVLAVETAKPLISVYVFGPVIGFDDFSQSGFPGHGRRDAFAGVSLDDGATWKRVNLSNSANESSFTISTGIPDPGLPHDTAAEFEVTGEWTISEVEYADEDDGGKLKAKGTDADRRAVVYVRNAVTKEVYTETDRASRSGEWEIEQERIQDPPCFVQAGDGAESWGPVVAIPSEDNAACGEAGGSTLITAYPGDVTNIFFAVASNKILVAWQSKFCQSGFPGYTGGNTDAATIAGYLGIDNTVDLYLTDLFGVAGSQGSVDYREQEDFPGEYDGVGEVPFNCLWSARGVLRENPDALGTTEVVWLQAERLTSGVRDVNRIEVSCVAGGGCGIVWQEDPQGLRPGEGEGAGTGWAGATTNNQTDIWFSFIEWEDFDIVNNNGTLEPLADTSLMTVLGTGRPQPGVPMAVPVRLTNNARCQTDATEGYCASTVATAYGLKDQCIDVVPVPAGQQGNLRDTCVVDANGDGTANTGDMVNIANTAASRPRLNLQPRDSDGDGITDDAWVIVIHEEDKGLGRYGFRNDEIWAGDLAVTGTMCGDPELAADDGCDKEIGKNQWYISFALGTPATSVSEDGIGIIDNLVSQQNQSNAPEVNWITGTFYPPMNTEDMWDFGDYNYLIFNTEIARRAALMSQPLSKALASESKIMAMPLFKEGVINQGGPADIMARRVALRVPEGSIPGAVCPIEVAADGPTIDSARYFVLRNGNGRIELQVDGLDGDLSTAVQTNNAVTGDRIVRRIYDETVRWTETTEDFVYRIAVGPGSTRPIPCAIQVADVDGSLDFGPWIPVENAPADCEGPIPAACYFDQGTTNPYAFENLECAWYDGEGGVTEGTWLFTDGSNPYYPKGLCTAPTINLSARTPLSCESTGGSDGVCPGSADMTCTDNADFGQLCQSTTDPEDNQLLDKMLSWYECPGSVGTSLGTGATMPACYTAPDSLLLRANLDDRSWYNPIDISKAHRGFLDGDFVFMLYAWSPNWKLNAVGNDRYELYTRRSFDGGVSWTTTPSSFLASDDVVYTLGDGTTTCETWRDGADSTTDSHVCTQYGPGAPEQSRNVTQHISMRITTLDPRYSPTIAGMPTAGDLPWVSFTPLAPTDVRRPDRNFVVFETGDNTTVSAGEAEPLNLDYGRAINFGDDYVVWAEDNLVGCYPNTNYAELDPAPWAVGTGFCNEFDALEGFPLSLSEEASISASAAGDFLYGVWGQFNVQEVEDPVTGEMTQEFVDGDVMFRRVWFLDGYTPSNAWTKGNQ